MRNFDWDDLRYFLATAAAGSLSAAARALNVNTTTVLRRIASLEDALNARLFERLRSGYSLTPEGARLLEQLDPIDQRLTALQRDFQAEIKAVKGETRIAVGDTIESQIIAPKLPDFATQNPDIALDIATDPSLAGPSTAPRLLNPLRDTDLAIRLARPTQGDMLVRKLGDMAYALYGAGENAPIKQGDLEGRRIIGFAKDEAPLGPIWYLSRAERAGEVVLRAASVATRMNAASAGLGIAALPCIIGDANRKLTRLAGPETVGSLEIWLLARSDMAQRPHIRAVMDFLIEAVAESAPRLTGQKTELA